MPVHMVYVCRSVSDRAQFEKYWASIGPTLEGVFVAEWPSTEAAKAWYDSPGYKAIRHLRQDNARDTGLLVEAGMVPPE